MNEREKQLRNEPAERFEKVEFNPNGWTKRIAGLTKREYFAGMAMQGLVSAQTYSVTDNTLMARMAVAQADALIAELSKDEE